MAQRAKLRLHTDNVEPKISAHASRGAPPPILGGRAKAREGTKLVGAHVPMATWRELHALRGELGVTMQALLVEAIEDVVAKHRHR
jgi:hypothetical protein